jgi:hypothetical protein
VPLNESYEYLKE